MGNGTGPITVVAAVATTPAGGDTPESNPAPDRGVITVTGQGSTYEDAYGQVKSQLEESMFLLHLRVERG